MQSARAFHLLQFLADLEDTFADQAAIGFDLCFTRTTQEAEAAALAFQVGPASDETAALIGEMRKLDLQATFSSLRAFAEDFEDQRCAIKHFRAPRLFQIALLHGAQLRIDDNDFRLERANFGCDLFNLAGADERCGPRALQLHDPFGDDVETDGGGEAHTFRKARFRIASEIVVRGRPRFGFYVYDK